MFSFLPVFFAALLLASCGGGDVSTGPVIKIACAGPLTGDQAQLGLDCCRGVKLAVDEANANGVAPAGTRFEFTQADDQHNPAQAVNVAKKFTTDRAIVGVIGHFNSSCTKPASAIYHEAQMTQITAASTNPELSRQGFNTFFRVAATDEVQGPKGAAFAAGTLGAKTVFIIDDKTTYGKGLADEFDKAIRAKGVTVLGHEGITQGDKDFTPLVTKILPLNPDLIYFGGIYPEGALLLRQMRSLNVGAKFMGGDGLATPIFVELATPVVAEGTYMTMVGGDMKKVPSAAAFVKAYEQKFGEVGQWSGYAYDAANILIAGVAKAGKNDRKAVLDAIHTTPSFSGVTGEIHFDKNGDNTNQFIGVFKVENGRMVYVGPAE